MFPHFYLDRSALRSNVQVSKHLTHLRGTEFVIVRPRAQMPVSGETFHSWNYPDGLPWAEFRRQSSAYHLRFSGLADFEVARDGKSIVGIPTPGNTSETIEHLCLNQVLPLALNQQGMLVFHGSAVLTGGGVVAFLAPTGHGKSTLAAAFATSGYRFLTDDSLVLEPEGGTYLAHPSHPSIRLWQDSHEKLLPANAPAALPVSYTPKSRLLAGDALAFCDVPRPLAAAYLLGPGEALKTTIRRLPASESLIGWAKHSFLLDIEDKVLIATHFDRLAHLANSVPCFHLDYPRNFDDLPGVLSTVVAHAEGLEGI